MKPNIRFRLFPIAAVIAACCLALSGNAWASKQVVAFFPLQNLADNTISGDLDVRLMASVNPDEPDAMRNKARGTGATYILAGAVSRIGRTVTMDLTLSAVEDPGKGRTVVVTGTEFARMATEAASKLKYLFFGDEVVGDGSGKRRIPKLSGTISRSRNIPGDIVSIAWGDTDRNGKPEMVAAYADALVVYRVEGDELVEMARIPDAGTDLIHVDAADINRNGIAEIITVRYVAGKSLSDVWEFDGNRYSPVARDIPYFLRALDMGKDGIVLTGQESDPIVIFKGPVFRLAQGKYGADGDKDKGSPLPLPDGTWIYSFGTLKNRDKVRFVTFGGRERIVLLDENGKKLWEGIDAVSGTETAIKAPLDSSGKEDTQQAARLLHLPNRLFGADLDGDKTDELIVLNNLVAAGGFFENIRVFSNAEALCFAQNGDSLQLAWRTAQAGNSARDSFVDYSPGGKGLRIGIVSRDKGKILGKYGEWNIIWLR
ncbi:MAG: hypothetical protein HW408_1663 [Actinobacteria bacterium]|nr:hypothetical protein [Actinomycetota bacterium]